MFGSSLVVAADAGSARRQRQAPGKDRAQGAVCARGSHASEPAATDRDIRARSMSSAPRPRALDLANAAGAASCGATAQAAHTSDKTPFQAPSRRSSEFRRFFMCTALALAESARYSTGRFCVRHRDRSVAGGGSRASGRHRRRRVRRSLSLRGGAARPRLRPVRQRHGDAGRAASAGAFVRIPYNRFGLGAVRLSRQPQRAHHANDDPPPGFAAQAVAMRRARGHAGRVAPLSGMTTRPGRRRRR